MKKHQVSTITLLFMSISSIIGSGWLFTAYYTSAHAGPAALVSWVIGGLAMILIAFTFAEICTLVPVTGSSTRIPQFTHGTVVSFIFSWMVWLSYAAMTPTEVQAVIQYLDFFIPNLTDASSALTNKGYLLSFCLMLAISVLNTYSLRWLIRANNVMTLMKILVPIIIVIALLFWLPLHSHQETFKFTKHNFAPFGLKGIFQAIALGGIVFAFVGFKTAAEMAGETKNPKVAIPFSILGSVVICLILFLFIQYAFLNALTSDNLASGWQTIVFANNTEGSPIAAILVQNDLSWLLPVLYVGAIIGPLAAGLIYCGSACRSLYGMSQNNYLPKFLQRLSADGNPIFAILVNFIIGMFMFAPLPGWNKMISFLTSLMGITYAIGPICLIALRKQVPQRKRPFKLPLAMPLSFLAFYVCTLMVYFCGWEILYKFAISLLIAVVILVGYCLTKGRHKQASMNWNCATWMWPYFIGLILVSYFGSFGGKNTLPFGVDFGLIGLICFVAMILSQKYQLSANATDKYIKTHTED